MELEGNGYQNSRTWIQKVQLDQKHNNIGGRIAWKKKAKKKPKAKELAQNLKKGALESQFPPSTFNTHIITCCTPKAKLQWVVITPGDQQEKQDTTNYTTTKKELIASFTMFSYLNKKRKMVEIKEEIAMWWEGGGIIVIRFWTI